MRLAAAWTLIFISMCGLAQANGKFYVPDTEVPGTPFQRALILYYDATQTLLLQSQYQVQQREADMSLGWVVPVPEEPALASMPAHSATDIFLHLAWRTRPRVTYIREIVFLFLICAAPCFFVFSLMLWFVYAVFPACFPGIPWKHTKTPTVIKWLPVCSFLILVFVTIGVYLTVRYGRAGIDMAGVDILREERVGVFDVKVIQSDDSKALITWLTENGFHFEEHDVHAFDAYVKTGWCFVVAHLAPNMDIASADAFHAGLAAPLVLTFPSEQPIYPLALTGTGGFDTEVLIYLVTEKFPVCDDDRLELLFAGQQGRFSNIHLHQLLSACEPNDFLPDDWPPLVYLTKYKRILTPEQMQTDVTFTLTDEDIFYTSHIHLW